MGVEKEVKEAVTEAIWIELNGNDRWNTIEKSLDLSKRFDKNKKEIYIVGGGEHEECDTVWYTG